MNILPSTQRLASVMCLVFTALCAHGTTVFTDTLETGSTFGVNGTWYTLRSGGLAPGSGYLSSITSATSAYRTLNYLYAQHQSAGTQPMDYLIHNKNVAPIDTSSYSGLYTSWLQQGDGLGGFSNYFAVQVDGNWYATNPTTTTAGKVSFNLLDPDLTWTQIDSNIALTSTTLTTAELFGLSPTITGVGFFVKNLPGYTSGNITLRLDNLRITDTLSLDNNWLGLGGAGGNGQWDAGGSSGYGNWETGTGYKWNSSNRQAVFGGVNDAGLGGTVTVVADLNDTGNRLQSPAGGDGYAMKFLSKANGYLIKGDDTLRSITLVGNIFVDSAAAVTFGNNLRVARGSDLYVSGGGTIVLDGTTLTNTSGYFSIIGGTTIEVKTGSVIDSANSFIIGSTVTGNTASGAAHLIVNGGTVNTEGNFILGNRAGTEGDVSMTVKSGGNINVSVNASNGLMFENTGASNAVLNLDGGVITTHRVARNGGTTGTTVFNFNGGVLRMSKEHSTLLNNSITYNVQENGAIIDTNGFATTINQILRHAGTGTDGGFTKRGDGILSLTSTNTYNGGTTIEGGTLSIQSNANLGHADGGITIHDNATLRVTAGNFGNRAIAIGAPTGTGTATIQLETNVLYGGIISNLDQAGSLNKTGSGTLTLLNANTYSGKTTITAGELALSLGDFADGSIDSSPWIEVLQNARFNTSDISDLYGEAAFNGKTFSGSGTFIGDYHLIQSKLRPGHTSTGNQGLANLADAGDLTGTLTFQGSLSLTDTVTTFQLGGIVDGSYDRLVIDGTLTVDSNTTFVVEWFNGFQAVHGNAFSLIDWSNLVGISNQSEFAALLELPDFDDTNLYWDTDDFFTTGLIRVAAIPEPSRSLLLTLALSTLLARRRRP